MKPRGIFDIACIVSAKAFFTCLGGTITSAVSILRDSDNVLSSMYIWRMPRSTILCQCAWARWKKTAFHSYSRKDFLETFDTSYFKFNSEFFNWYIDIPTFCLRFQGSEYFKAYVIGLIREKAIHQRDNLLQYKTMYCIQLVEVLRGNTKCSVPKPYSATPKML